jgi:hypothetical protein
MSQELFKFAQPVEKDFARLATATEGADSETFTAARIGVSKVDYLHPAPTM